MWSFTMQISPAGAIFSLRCHIKKNKKSVSLNKLSPKEPPGCFYALQAAFGLYIEFQEIPIFLLNTKPNG